MNTDPRYPWLSMPGDGNPVWTRPQHPDCDTCDNTGEVEHKSGDTIIPLPCLDCPRGDAPLHEQPWPPDGMRVVVNDPNDPWGGSRLEPKDGAA